MPDLRAEIQSALDARGWSAYRLARELADPVPERTIRAYLAGQDLGGEAVGRLMDALGLRVGRSPTRSPR